MSIGAWAAYMMRRQQHYARIEFAPIRHSNDPQDGSCASGLAFVCRIDVVRRFWPVPRGVPRDPAQGALWAQTLEPQRRLLAHALAEERGKRAPDAALTEQVEAMPADAVLEALREVASRADCAALGLPAFGLLRPAAAVGRRHKVPMRVALAVLARRRGGIFLREADPIAPASLTDAFDLWTPQPPPGAER